MSPSNRVDPRLVLGLDADYRIEGSAEWRSGRIHDLSTSGAALLTPEPIPLQTLLRLRFRLPAGSRDPEAELVIEAMGVRKAERPEIDASLPHLQGVYFLDLRGERFDRLKRFLWERSDGVF